MRELAYVNGETVDLESAVIPILDRGFLFGDGIYEVVRVYKGVPFALDRHLNRFQRSAAEIKLALPHTLGTFEDLVTDLLEESGLQEGWVYLQVTRGIAPRNHTFPEVITPTVVMFVNQIPPDEADLRGVTGEMITLPDKRWLHCNIKSLNLLGNILGKETARSQGAFECMFYREGGKVTEAGSANVFAVIDGVVRTHPATHLILQGITRDLVLEICADEGIPFDETAFYLEDLDRATEVFTTSSVAEITPIIRVDNKPVGDGIIGPITSRLLEGYATLVAQAVK